MAMQRMRLVLMGLVLLSITELLAAEPLYVNLRTFQTLKILDEKCQLMPGENYPEQLNSQLPYGWAPCKWTNEKLVIENALGAGGDIIFYKQGAALRTIAPIVTGTYFLKGSDEWNKALLCRGQLSEWHWRQGGRRCAH